MGHASTQCAGGVAHCSLVVKQEGREKHMASSQIHGQHFQVDATSLTIFQHLGGRRGTNWVLNMPIDAPDGSWLVYETKPMPLSSQVSAVLAADTAAGRDHLIKFLVVSPQIVVSLFLEGILTLHDFLRADETPDAVILEDVLIDERAWTLVVVAAPDASVTTVDADGQTV